MFEEVPETGASERFVRPAQGWGWRFLAAATVGVIALALVVFAVGGDHATDDSAAPVRAGFSPSGSPSMTGTPATPPQTPGAGYAQVAATPAPTTSPSPAARPTREQSSAPPSGPGRERPRWRLPGHPRTGSDDHGQDGSKNGGEDAEEDVETVDKGDRCHRFGAISLTADGEIVVCAKGRDGRLRWRDL